MLGTLSQTERRIGAVSDVICSMCGRVARETPCGALCRQWEKRVLSLL